MENTIAVIQARMGSTRLPCKVLADISGKPLLWHVVNRLLHSKTLDKIVISTTTSPIDDEVATFCKQEGFYCYRGSEDDVLDRYYQTLKKYPAKRIVRITADCPLIDPSVVDDVVNLQTSTGADYASNISPPTFPDGLDTEVFLFQTLDKVWNEANYKYQREHVTGYISDNPEIFKTANLKYARDLSHWRITVDYPEDFEVVRIIYDELYHGDNCFGLSDIEELIARKPEILELNKKYVRNASYNTDDN